MKRRVFRSLAVLSTLPVVIYTLMLCGEAGRLALKSGWQWRPFIFVSVQSIVVYVIYVAAGTATFAWTSDKLNDRILRWCAMAFGLMLGIYWSAFLTYTFAVLPNR